MRLKKAALILVPLFVFACAEEEPVAPTGDALDGPPLALANHSDVGQVGPYEVGFTSLVIHDATRANRPIPIYVWYPVDGADIDNSTPEAVYPLDPFFGSLPDAVSSDFEQYGLDRAYQEPPPLSTGPFQLVMFSPGWGAAAYDHAYVGTRLASHGFVVAAVTHFGDGTSINPGEPSDPLAVASFNRPRDVSAALDALLAMTADETELLYGVIDPSMVVASGWSLGGYASMVLAGGDDSVCDLIPIGDIPPWTCAPSYPDPRIQMIIPLDGSSQILYFTELARVEVPALGMGEEWSTLVAVFGEGFASWQARHHAAFSGHPAYRADVNMANHWSFSNICESLLVLRDYGLIGPSDVDPIGFCSPPWISWQEAHGLVTKYMVAFLTHQQHILTPGYAITSEPDIEFFVTERRSPSSIEDDWPDHFIYFMHQPGNATAKAHAELTAMAEKDPAGRLPVEFVGGYRQALRF